LTLYKLTDTPPRSQPFTSPPCFFDGSDEVTTSYAIRGGGIHSDRLTAVAVDGAGAVVAAGLHPGYFSSPATFGGVVLSTTDEEKAVVWKMNAEGTTLWAVHGSSSGDVMLYGVAVDGARAVVAAGSLDTDLYPATFGDVVLTAAWGVVWKMSAEGTTLWAVTGGMAVNTVAVDGAGAVVAAGEVYSTKTVGDVALTSVGDADAAVWKMSADGTTLWAVRGGGSYDSIMYAVAVDGANAVVAAGVFDGSTATFGGVVLTNVGSTSYSDAVVWKMSAAGTTLWAVRGGGRYFDRVRAVVVDSAGAVVAAGQSATRSATFGDVVLNDGGSSYKHALVWKMSADGTTLWAVSEDDPDGGSMLNGVAVDGAGAVVAAGHFGSDRLDGMMTLGGVVLNTAGSHDAVLWKLSGEGTSMWAVRGGGEDYDVLQAVTMDGAGGVVAVGHFVSTMATFGDVVLANAWTPWSLYEDAVVWKVSDAAESTMFCSTSTPLYHRAHRVTRPFEPSVLSCPPAVL